MRWRKAADFARAVKSGRAALARSVTVASTAGASGIALTPLRRTIEADGYHYETLEVEIDRAGRTRER